MGADEDGGVFLVKIDFGGLFLLGKSCSHRLILSTAAGRSGAATGDAGIALSGFMYPAIGRALSRFSGAATLDTGILGSECADTQNASSQRNEHCTKNAFPNSLFHGKVLSVMYGGVVGGK